VTNSTLIELLFSVHIFLNLLIPKNVVCQLYIVIKRYSIMFRYTHTIISEYNAKVKTTGRWYMLQYMVTDVCRKIELT
jgi:hypothetical protein